MFDVSRDDFSQFQQGAYLDSIPDTNVLFDLVSVG